MNIIYASDDKYSELAGISILSLFENNKNIEKIKIYILDNGISLDNKIKIENIANTYSRNISFIDMPDIEKLTNMKYNVGSYYSITTFSRLFMASIIPKNITKAIYIDCDTIICGSLLPLWEFNQGSYILSAVLDIRSRYGQKAIFLDKNDVYVNCGVLLIDLKRWRELNVEEKAINFIKLMAGKVHIVDQGVINAVLKGHIGLLPPEYNYSLRYTGLNYWLAITSKDINNFYNEQLVKNARENPVIVHFLGCDIRPWIEGNNHPIFQDEYMKYRDMSPWASTPLFAPPPAKRSYKKWIRKMLAILPKPFYHKCSDIRRMFRNKDEYYYARKRLRQSDIQLEDCQVKIEINKNL